MGDVVRKGGLPGTEGSGLANVSGEHRGRTPSRNCRAG